MADELPDWLALMPADRVLRIDLGFEGDWSATVTTVWRPDAGYLGVGQRSWRHPHCRPALELYLEDGWLGVRCDRGVAEGFELDEGRVQEVVRWVEGRR